MNVAHRLLFKQNATQARVVGEKTKTANVGGKNDHWHNYYHTHQRKMMAMEVDDAFRIRRWVLYAMGAVALVMCIVGLWVGGKVVAAVTEVMGANRAAIVPLAVMNEVHA